MHPQTEKILARRMRKGPPRYVGMGPRMVNPALDLDRIMNDTHTEMSELVHAGTEEVFQIVNDNHPSSLITFTDAEPSL